MVVLKKGGVLWTDYSSRGDRLLLALDVRPFCRFETNVEYARERYINWAHVGAVCRFCPLSSLEDGKVLTREEIKAEERKANEEFLEHRLRCNRRGFSHTQCETVLKSAIGATPFSDEAFPQIHSSEERGPEPLLVLWNFILANPLLETTEIDISTILDLYEDKLYRTQRKFFAAFVNDEITGETLKGPAMTAAP